MRRDVCALRSLKCGRLERLLLIAWALLDAKACVCVCVLHGQGGRRACVGVRGCIYGWYSNSRMRSEHSPCFGGARLADDDDDDFLLGRYKTHTRAQ